ncbi:MAG: hypothetical protein ABIJ56_21760 [Pseudomonadota bacterium]
MDDPRVNACFLIILFLFVGTGLPGCSYGHASEQPVSAKTSASPMEPGPILPSGTEETGTDREPATKPAKKVVDTIEMIEQTMTATRYQHFTMVDRKKGLYFWDCSGMTAWILDRAAPKARKSLPAKHPLAKQFYKVIAKSPTDKQKKGWQRLEGLQDVRPGDMFAWLKPEFWKNNKNTGHVGFVLDTPRPHPKYENVWLMKIADASRYRHENDSRPDDGQGGFGTGTIAFLVDGNGTGQAYGWYGSPQKPQTYIPTTIIFGRVTK